MFIIETNVKEFEEMSPEEIPEKYLEEWKKGMDVAMNVHKTGNKTLSDSDNSGVGTSFNKSFMKTRILNLTFSGGFTA